MNNAGASKLWYVVIMMMCPCPYLLVPGGHEEGVEGGAARCTEPCQDQTQKGTIPHAMLEGSFRRQQKNSKTPIPNAIVATAKAATVITTVMAGGKKNKAFQKLRNAGVVSLPSIGCFLFFSCGRSRRRPRTPQFQSIRILVALLTTEESRVLRIHPTHHIARRMRQRPSG